MKQQLISFLKLDKASLVGLPVSSLTDGLITDFDLFIKVKGQYLIYAPSPYHWSREEVERLEKQGFSELYYAKSDQEKVALIQKITDLPKINQSLNPRERVVHIVDIAAAMNKAFYEHPFTTAALKKGEEVAEALFRCVEEDPACVSALGVLSDHDQYTFYHSARVAAYSLAVAINMSLSDDEQLHELALGSLLHDLGKTKISLSILNKPGPLTESEWVEIRRHPIYGMEVIGEEAVPFTSREIILHHHERIDGRGYPHGLTKPEILPEVSIAAFADVFDALTVSRPYQRSRSKYEALDFIRFHLLDDYFKEPFSAMIDLLKTPA